VTLAVLTQVPEAPTSPAVVVVGRVDVSTVRPGRGSNLSRFAAASVIARDASSTPRAPGRRSSASTGARGDGS
jgi:hypothetical protein